jgi:hypothetical protein
MVTNISDEHTVFHQLSDFKKIVMMVAVRSFEMRDFRLPLRCKGDLHSSGILRSADWLFLTDVSGQPIIFIFNGQAVSVLVTHFLQEIKEHQMAF